MTRYRLNLRGSVLHFYPRTKRYGWSAWDRYSGDGVPVSWVYREEAQGFIERNGQFARGAVIESL